MRCLQLAVLGAVACGGGRGTPRLPIAGGDGDDGAGQLAEASHKLRLGGDDATGFADPARHAVGGAGYGGDGSLGGTTYAGYQPVWNVTPPAHGPSYRVYDGPTGAVAGVVTWPALPPSRAPACGAPRLAANHAVAGTLVYVERVSLGRAMPYAGRPVTVGGVVEKRGCALVPTVQVAGPLPVALMIHGDAARATIQATLPGGERRTFALDEGGVARLSLLPGVTRLDGDDGQLAAAWVVGVTTPYFAITDDDGRYRLDELPPGRYEVTFWQPPPPAIAADGHRTYGAPIVVKRGLMVGAGRTTVTDVALPPPGAR